ncbi:alpha/beta hydrolase [Bifidobacterium callitrichidarum]|uniref:Alpha/beta hydrolase n=2 Tax=Bifidobacterium callitrichidarum TaxID=2052941 RepID=A0A2U2N713_9BIFI|nr:alpha/beta hydrolase [Bifidobacterium callitrichidarum]
MSTPQQPQYPPYDPGRHAQPQRQYPAGPGTPYGTPPGYVPQEGPVPQLPPMQGMPPNRPRRKMPTWLVITIALLVAVALNIAIIFGITKGVAQLIRSAGEYGSTNNGFTVHSATPPPEPAARPDSVSAAFDKYYTQQYVWKSCDQGDGCATFTAPSDWSDPDSKPIELHAAIHFAEDYAMGTLFINPGGPGASGADWLNDFVEYTATDDLREHYDIIGFDPRGVADSTPITCGTDTTLLDDYFLADPITADNLDQSRAIAQRFADACRTSSGDIIDHVDTQSVARDLDMLRALAGQTRLNYLGFSYGTYIGSTYAALFPKQTGRIVLDGAINPTEDSATSTIEQAVGFEKALATYLNDCIKNDGSCPFKGMDTNQATKEIQSWLATADTKPWPTSSGKRVNGITMMYGIILPLYSEDNWTYLTQAFKELKDTGKADTLLLLADTYLGRNENGKYTDNSMEANLAVNCLDDPPTSDMARQEAIAKELGEKAPTFGRFMTYGNIGCEALKQDRSGIGKLDYSAPGASPILVVGTTGDPATPYQAAVNLAKLLESGVLLTYKGEGHTAYTYTNSCVAETVDDFLIHGKVPSSDVTCG